MIIKKIEIDFYKYSLPDSNYMDSVYAYRTKSWGIIAGIGINKNITGEIGYGRALYGVTWHHWSLASYYLGSEFLYQNDKFIFAPKISLWGNGGSAPMALGLNLIYYTNLNKFDRFVFRPEIGLGYYKFKLVWGYNIALINTESNYISKNNFSLIWFFDTNSKKTESLTYRESLKYRIDRELKRQKKKNAP